MTRAKASLFAWPMVHNWFVSMGMLDFAIAVPLSLALLLAIDRQRTAPSITTGLAIVGLGAATWYAHVFPLLVVHMHEPQRFNPGDSWLRRKAAQANYRFDAILMGIVESAPFQMRTKLEPAEADRVAVR